jgi:predicted AlkP superfamily phosphohydrolase/phosphomutase
MNKAVVIGLDGATWRVFDPMIEAGELPAIARLKQQGAWGRLNSTIPPLTPPGWTTGITGKNPGKHNVFDFFKYDSRDYDIHLTSRKDRKSRAIWNFVSDAGGSVLVMNVPHTYPPEKVNGHLVSGFGTPEWKCEYTWPPELKKRILDTWPDFVVDIPSNLLHKGQFNKFLAQLNSHSTTHWNVFRELYEEQQPDFAMYAFVEMDRLFHFFWKEFEEQQSPVAEMFRDHIRHIDRLVGEFLDSLPSDTHVILISDHGFCRVERDIYINNWLMENGYLALKDGAAAAVKAPMSVRIKKVIIGLLSAVGLWKYYLSWRRKKLEAAGDTASTGSAEVDVKTTWYLHNVDWHTTQAAFHSMACRGIRLNVKGRDALGCVEPEEAEALAREIRDRILEMRDPESGRRLITRAWLARDVYHGPYVDNAADIYLEPAELHSMHHGFATTLTMPSMQHDHPRSGDHDQYGVFMACGEHIAAGEVTGISLADITPTVLHLMDLPVSTDMDGSSITAALHDEWAQKNPVKPIEEPPYYSDEKAAADDEEKLKERLRDLGYL